MFTVLTMCTPHSVFAQMKLVPIEEPRTMETRLFASADQTLVQKYMPTGGAPASMSSFVLFAGEETILFDAGLGGETWVKKLTDAGVQPENVKYIFLTHSHGDHIGGLLQDAARRFPNAKVLCSALEYEHWKPTPSFAKIKSAYGQDFETTFKFDDVVFENSKLKIKALDAVGHTPGHTAFLIEPKDTAKEKVLIVGDLLHAAALQFPAPEVCSQYDRDHEKTVASRKRILDFAAQEKIPVAGMHFPAPHVLLVEKNDQGGYTFRAVPEPGWQSAPNGQ